MNLTPACFVLARFPARQAPLTVRSMVRLPSGRLFPLGDFMDFQTAEEARAWLQPQCTACFDVSGKPDQLFELWWVEPPAEMPFPKH